MCKAYVDLPTSVPNALLRTEHEVRYKEYAPKIYQRKAETEKNTK